MFTKFERAFLGTIIVYVVAIIVLICVYLACHTFHNCWYN